MNVIVDSSIANFCVFEDLNFEFFATLTLTLHALSKNSENKNTTHQTQNTQPQEEKQIAKCQQGDNWDKADSFGI